MDDFISQNNIENIIETTSEIDSDTERDILNVSDISGIDENPLGINNNQCDETLTYCIDSLPKDYEAKIFVESKTECKNFILSNLLKPVIEIKPTGEWETWSMKIDAVQKFIDCIKIFYLTLNAELIILDSVTEKRLVIENASVENDQTIDIDIIIDTTISVLSVEANSVDLKIWGSTHFPKIKAMFLFKPEFKPEKISLPQTDLLPISEMGETAAASDSTAASELYNLDGIGNFGADWSKKREEQCSLISEAKSGVQTNVNHLNQQGAKKQNFDGIAKAVNTLCDVSMACFDLAAETKSKLDCSTSQILGELGTIKQMIANQIVVGTGQKSDGHTVNLTHLLVGKSDPRSALFPVDGGLVFKGLFFNFQEHMHQFWKAIHHNKMEVAVQVLMETDGIKAKRLTDQFEEEPTWKETAIEMVDGMLALKYRDCDEFRTALDQDNPKTIYAHCVQNPDWGTGFSKRAPENFDERKWVGKNEYGKRVAMLKAKTENAEALCPYEFMSLKPASLTINLPISGGDSKYLVILNSQGRHIIGGWNTEVCHVGSLSLGGPKSIKELMSAIDFSEIGELVIAIGGCEIHEDGRKLRDGFQDLFATFNHLRGSNDVNLHMITPPPRLDKSYDAKVKGVCEKMEWASDRIGEKGVPVYDCTTGMEQVRNEFHVALFDDDKHHLNAFGSHKWCEQVLMKLPFLTLYSNRTPLPNRYPSGANKDKIKEFREKAEKPNKGAKTTLLEPPAATDQDEGRGRLDNVGQQGKRLRLSSSGNRSDSVSDARSRHPLLSDQQRYGGHGGGYGAHGGGYGGYNGGYGTHSRGRGYNGGHYGDNRGSFTGTRQ